MKIITVAIQRGGTAKTTTALALAQAAAADKKRVLAIDLDPQGNMSFALHANMEQGSTLDLLEGTPAKQIIQHSPQGLDVIPASWGLSTVATTQGSANRLRKALQPLKPLYDLIVIDTPPTPGEMQYNALQAATDLIIPLGADVFGMQGLYQIADTAREFMKTNPELKIAGIVITRHNPRSTIAKQMQQNIENAAAEMGIPFLKAIRAGIAIQEAQALQESLFDYAPTAKPAQDYMELYSMIAE